MEAAGQERDGWDGRNEETHKSASSKSSPSACGQVLSSMWKVRQMIINFYNFFGEDFPNRSIYTRTIFFLED